ncbi:LysR substrate-binding domain-containing protein [Caballeronia hypogeia]|uniref:LysR substrate-binding domain-containing protein n=1 Tax=Caballeronia hypogeia TaxID=1777140 RepID=UPI00094182F1|nr:LysR substrate-binding domain-containing protein [Caballeronia hypogeia]
MRLHAPNDPVDLTRESVDIDLRYGARRLQPAGTLVLDLPSETIVPLCSPKLMEGANAIRTVADLKHHTLIHSENCLVGWRDWMRMHRKTPLDISRGPRFDRSFTAISAAADGGRRVSGEFAAGAAGTRYGQARGAVRIRWVEREWEDVEPAEVVDGFAEGQELSGLAV